MKNLLVPVVRDMCQIIYHSMNLFLTTKPPRNSADSPQQTAALLLRLGRHRPKLNVVRRQIKQDGLARHGFQLRWKPHQSVMRGRVASIISI
jgi:hypothetical protein